jgi:8-oxo-dGTP pyrophosphatase MutT (NUDIX family)
MTDARVIAIERLDLAFAPRPWAFAVERRAEIDAGFAALRRENPALWNGQVLLLHEHAIEGRTLRGSFLQTDYASFRMWHDWGHPDRSIRDCFAQAVLVASDGALLLGVMAPQTAVPGRIHFPSGTPDPSDIAGDTVDLQASAWRELAEETGLTPADLTADAGWHAVLCGTTMAMMKILRSRENAVALRRRIVGVLAQQEMPELVDMRIVRGPHDTDPMMPDFVRAFLAFYWAGPGR